MNKDNKQGMSEFHEETNNISMRQQGMQKQYNSRNAYIKKLQDKNKQLQNQINKVAVVLTHLEDQKNNKNSLLLIRADVVDKELQNVYKKIKSYEKDIVMRRKQLGSDEGYQQQINKLEQKIAERAKKKEQLKNQLAAIRKDSMGNDKLLRDDSFRQEYDSNNGKIASELKWLEYRFHESMAKEEAEEANAKKLVDHIRKLEESLKKVCPKIDLNQIKRRIQNGKKNQEKIQKHENHSLQNYKENLSSIKLYEKLKKQNEEKIAKMQKQRQLLMQENNQQRKRLLQMQYEIEKREESIGQLRSKTTSFRHRKNSPRLYELSQRQKPQLPLKAKHPNLNIYSSYKIGEHTRKGFKFSDRIMLGQKPAKIIEITFYEFDHILVGFQIIYQQNGLRKKSKEHLCVHNQRSTADKKTVALESGDYFRIVKSVLNPNGLIVGLVLTSKRGVIAEGGSMQGRHEEMDLKENEYPVCVYGSLLPSGIEMFGIQYARQYRDKQ